jgi:hypothetical protein
MDYYLLACWMFMTVPDYKGLAGLSDSMKQVIGYYEVSEEQKKLFAEHHNKEENSDWNADGGFGGPVPLIGRALGNATFYLSFNGRERHYIMPVSRSSDESYTTLLTVKSQPTQKMTLTWNTLYKYQIGVSPIRPASGDYPDASRQGGFMSANNIKYIAKNPEYWFDPPFFPILEQKTLMNGLTINKIVNKATFWELSLSGLRIRDNSETGNTRDTTAITHFGPLWSMKCPTANIWKAPTASLEYLTATRSAINI